MEDNLLYRIDELTKIVNSLTTKIDKINDTIMQFKLADSTIGFKLDTLEKDMILLKEEQKEQKKIIQDLKDAPLKKDANNWRQIMQSVLKYSIDVALIGVLIKLGLK